MLIRRRGKKAVVERREQIAFERLGGRGSSVDIQVHLNASCFDGVVVAVDVRLMKSETRGSAKGERGGIVINALN